MHISEFDYFIEKSSPLPVFSRGVEPNEAEKQIGQNVAGLIKDGDTIQMGIGSISEAVVAGLDGKHDLGILTEMFPPSLPELVEKGIVTNSKKIRHTGVSLACLCIGDQKLYDYVAENPAAQIYPGSYTNNPALIAQNPSMVSINTAIMMDLTGNITSEGIGHRMISGVGGQLEFQMGAYWSPGGRAITVMTAARRMKDGTLASSILPALPLGSPVSVPKNFADYVVTEYGVARLKYKSFRGRAEALISIAHPDFRGELQRAARRIFYPQ
jgi:4-hydroxybutyrate CoA-transferase